MFPPLKEIITHPFLYVTTSSADKNWLCLCERFNQLYQAFVCDVFALLMPMCAKYGKSYVHPCQSYHTTCMYHTYVSHVIPIHRTSTKKIKAIIESNHQNKGQFVTKHLYTFWVLKIILGNQSFLNHKSIEQTVLAPIYTNVTSVPTYFLEQMENYVSYPSR